MLSNTALVCLLVLAIAPQAQNRASHHAYLGFDRNDYRGDEALPALHRTFAFSGYWLNAPPGATQTDWLGKRHKLQEAGFGFALLFNGKLYRELQGKDASAIGKNDGQSAVAAARREGFPAHAVIFLDQEEGGRLFSEQKAYLYAWSDALISAGYRAGVYCSGMEFVEGGGAHVITARDIRDNAGRRDITYWVSNDTCPPSPGCTFTHPPEPGSSGVRFAEIWQFAQLPRRAEQTGRCAATYHSDGNCYPPGLGPPLHIDVSSSTTSDPSHARSER